MFALCLVSGHTVEIIRAFFCFPVNGVLCFCLVVAMFPCCQRRRFSLCSQKVSHFLKVITELRIAKWWHMKLKKQGKLNVEAIDNSQNMHISSSTFRGEFSEIALCLIPLPGYSPPSFLLDSAVLRFPTQVLNYCRAPSSLEQCKKNTTQKTIVKSKCNAGGENGESRGG